MVLLSLYLQNRALDFDDFSQMLEIVALSDLAAVLCARKFSFAPRGIGPKIALFSFLFIIIILLFIHYYF